MLTTVSVDSVASGTDTSGMVEGGGIVHGAGNVADLETVHVCGMVAEGGQAAGEGMVRGEA